MFARFELVIEDETVVDYLILIWHEIKPQIKFWRFTHKLNVYSFHNELLVITWGGFENAGFNDIFSLKAQSEMIIFR